MTHLVRPVREADLDMLVALAEGAGQGLTTLPANPDTLRARIARSTAAFGRNSADRQETESFLMVLEEAATGRVCGTSGVYVGVGRAAPFWNFRRSIHSHFCTELGIRVDSTVLMLANDYTGATEVGTLYLEPGSRVNGNGSLLARARYLLMASAPARFGDMVIAELRGWLDEAGDSPFWQAVGHHFFQMSFDRADYLSGTGQGGFIADLMPKFPIYADLLPEPARKVIGLPQEASRPAFHMLVKEGFRISHSVDIFDAGPVLEAHPRDLATIRDSRARTIAAVVPDEADDLHEHLACVPDLARFRAARVRLRRVSQETVEVSQSAAALLDVAPGDPLRCVGC
ncbi:arginine N-succinyltransferase [Caenispirillum bisanense]|uniref:Arginine succinyltransferase n=1 Tax=Caenispirillum bisanense TaxID=414052 RepID=A0A286G5J7_9PROT|nr:arginine N-succinyltransferase [Caenispirillum bisanense]SOD90827.1 arginine succinyltransferase [Caenispirillum bisanense]